MVEAALWTLSRADTSAPTPLMEHHRAPSDTCLWHHLL